MFGYTLKLKIETFGHLHYIIYSPPQFWQSKPSKISLFFEFLLSQNFLIGKVLPVRKQFAPDTNHVVKKPEHTQKEEQ